MNGFIVFGLDQCENKFYISNISPIIWTDKIEDAKLFEKYNYAVYDLEENFMHLSVTISNSNLIGIFIAEYINGEICRQKRFI